jgi:aspartyl-tRNA(Asn)/glutamyl-tRNA(Gln) amidotransferase subunit A
MSDQPLWSQPIENLAPEIQAGRLSPIEIIDTLMERIGTYDGEIKSFVCFAPNARAQAETAAKEIAEGNYKGPLHGIPIAVKDNYFTADMPTRAGSNSAVDYPKIDSSCVAKLREAGAIIIGKTNMHEFAWGNETPPTRNPWNTNHVPGGSSGGSGAAIAAGFVPAALGSDTGGSIRIPAGLCGTVGIKPTYGLVGRSGIVPHSWSLDHAGPLTATVADAAFITEALVGHDKNDPGSVDRVKPNFASSLGTSVEGMRVGICRNHFFDALQTDVEVNVEKAISELSKLGCKIVEFKVPNLEYGLAAIFAIELASSTAWHDSSLAAGLTADYQSDVRTLVEIGRFVTAPDYLKAEQLRRVLMEDFARAFSEIDVVVGPTLPLTAWRVGDRSVRIGDSDESVLAASWRLTYPWNLIGVPALSIPCGLDTHGLPIGLQFAAPPFRELDLFRIAHAYEAKQDWKGARATLQGS